MRKRDRTSARRWIGKSAGRGLSSILGAALLLPGCGRHEIATDVVATTGPLLPSGLAKVVRSTAALHVRVRLDDIGWSGTVKNVTLSEDGTRLSNFKVSLPPGDHSIFLEYLLFDPSCIAEEIRLARTTKVEGITIDAENATVDFSAASIEHLFDDDNDGTTNLDELEAGTFPCLDAIPASPLSLRLAPANKQITVQWDAVANAESYDVYYGTDADLTVRDYEARGGVRRSGALSPLVISDLENDIAYTVLVTARNGQGESTPVSGRVAPVAEPLTAFSVNFRVSGLRGSLTLTAGSENVTVASDGEHRFATMLANGEQYQVAVAQQPANQTCAVGGVASGTIDEGHVYGIYVTCDPPLYRITAHVAGLQTATAALQNNGGDDLTVTGDGPAEFDTRLPGGRAYAVSIRTQPDAPRYCIVRNAMGTVAAADVSSISIDCFTLNQPAYGVGGAVVGLTGRLVLQNGVEELVISRNGPYRFGLPLVDGARYEVAILRQPAAQTCIVSNGDGQVNDGDITHVSVTCTDSLILDANPFDREIELTWTMDDLATYNVYVSTSSGCDISNYTACSGGSMAASVRSPHMLTNLRNAQIYYIRLEAVYDGLSTKLSDEERARPGQMVPNGMVRDIEIGDDGTVYLAGDFTRFSVPAGAGMVVDASTGRKRSAFQIEGTVRAVVSDGAGGWYVGGQFSHVNGVPRANLVHILDDDSVDPVFDVPVHGDPALSPYKDFGVHALFVYNGRLYIGGSFESVGGTERKNLAAVVLPTGVVEQWEPAPSHAVRHIVGNASRVYIAGDFYSVARVLRRWVAAFDHAGELQDWNPTFKRGLDTGENLVRSIAAATGRVFVAGPFESVDGVERRSLAAFSDDGTLNSDWAGFDGGAIDISDMHASTHGLYVAGKRGRANAVTRIDFETGAILNSLAVGSELRIYLAGGDERLYAASGDELYAADQASLPTWKWTATKLAIQSVNTMAVADNGLFVHSADNFASENYGEARDYVAAINSDGSLLPWNPAPNDSVSHIVVTPSTVYALGAFSKVGNQDRRGLAAIDKQGNLSDWNPGALGSIPSATTNRMVHLQDTLYFGGNFAQFAGQNRLNTAALDATGAVTAWDPRPNGEVTALETNGVDTVFLGGSFRAIGTEPRRGLAAVGVDGTLRSGWSLATDGLFVTALARSDLSLYVGGNVSEGNFPIIRRTGLLEAFSLDGSAQRILTSRFGHGQDVVGSSIPVVVSMTFGSRLYVAGDFGNVNNTSRVGVAAVNGAGGDVLDWNPSPGARSISVIRVHPLNGKVYLGGSFLTVFGRLQPRFAIVDPPQ